VIYHHISEIIGRTPLLRIAPEVHGLPRVELYAKLELFNPFGSLKDRMAWAMLRDEIPALQIAPKTVLESSSGNTAKGLAVLAGVHGLTFKTITNRINVPEVKKILKIIGAEIVELPGVSECPDPSDPNNPLAEIEREMVRRPDCYLHTSQYTNLKNPQAHYDSTGREIYDDLGEVDFLFGTLGTTGSTRGIAAFLKERYPALVSVGVIAAKGDFIPGIRNVDEMQEVGIFERSRYDHILAVDSAEAIEDMLLLVRRCGVLCGPTSGAALRGALSFLRPLAPSFQVVKKAVVIICDRLEWYISYIEKRRPDLFAEHHGPGHSGVRAFKLAPDARPPEMPVTEAVAWVAAHHPLIVDLRGALGFRAGHIAGSLNLVDSIFEDLLDRGIPFSLGQKVLLVCPSGDRSARYAAFLREKGVEAYSLQGGLMAWRDAGLPLERRWERVPE